MSTREPGLIAYCLVTGALASAAGAGASLLGGGLWTRLTMWLTVLVGVSAVAGWWWVRSPATARQWTVDLLVRPGARDAPSRRA
ncbi:hypothetical protein GCM10017668_27650 [Streptomyces tuirus]|uniref:Uncharacterized protein n=1 Tax=Streptomyces tuirus TaxID=68278 RepID=A0A7G1NFD9_9ACTN|nr:hypothetical protein GCM10017668_27650 [Streptomyces tuirus]